MLTVVLFDVFPGMGMQGAGRGFGMQQQGHFNPAFAQGQGGQFQSNKRFKAE